MFDNISETIQAMPITFAEKTLCPIKGLYDHCQSDDLDLHDHKFVSDYLTCNNSDNIEDYIQIWHDGRLMDACSYSF